MVQSSALSMEFALPLELFRLLRLLDPALRVLDPAFHVEVAVLGGGQFENGSLSKLPRELKLGLLILPTLEALLFRFEAIGVLVADAGGGHSNDRAGSGAGVDTAIGGAGVGVGFGVGVGVGVDFLGNRPLSVVVPAFFGAVQSASHEALLLSVPFPVAFTLSFAGPLRAIVFMSRDTGSTSFTTTPRFSSIFLRTS